MFSNLMTKFEWKGFNAINPVDKSICIKYIYLFNRLSTALIAENKLDSAVLVLDKCVATLTNEIFYFDYNIIPIIENYYKLNEFEKANKIAKLVAHNHLHENMDLHYEKQYGKSVDKRAELKKTALERLKELATDYNQQELLKILGK
jgi:hypothetical protein